MRLGRYLYRKLPPKFSDEAQILSTSHFMPLNRGEKLRVMKSILSTVHGQVRLLRLFVLFGVVKEECAQNLCRIFEAIFLAIRS